MIPLGTDRPNRRPTLVVYALIVANLAAYVAQVVVVRIDPDLAGRIIEPLLLQRDVSEPWTSLTYLFLHADFWHVFFNMVFLWVFGPNVEDRFGRVGFLIFYVLGGVAAGIGHTAFSPNPVLGASGAVAAITGAFLVLFPRTHIRLFMFFIIIGLFSIPSWWFIVFAIVRDFIPFAANLGGRTAYGAHLGGYTFGISVSLFLLATRSLSREPYDLFSIAKHRRRRRKFFDAARQAQVRAERVSSTRKMSKAEERAANELTEARSAVAEKIKSDDLDGAVDAYRRLLGEFGHDGSASTLNRANQLLIANHLYRSEDHQTAALAYELFLGSNTNDTEAPGVRLLLGLINARHLNDPVRAKQLLDQVKGRLRTDDEEKLVEQLIEELG